MTDLIHLDDTKRGIFERALLLMGEFHEAFGRSLTPHFVAELHAAKALNLELYATSNHPSCDAVSTNGERYEIKYRSRTTQNIDVNSFEFEFVALVEMNDAYQLTGLWCMTADQAQEIFVYRDKFRKYQTTTKKFKSFAERIQ